MENKKYDWLAIQQYQPDYSLADLKDLGITPDNTELRARDYYKDLKAVRESDFFAKENGEFDEKKFDKFYDESALLYNNYANKEVFDNLAKNYSYDPWEWWNSDPSKIKDVQPKMTLGENPLMTTMGIKGLDIATETPFSIRELAQRNKYYDTVLGEWSDKTPNDFAGVFKSWAAPTLVLATYDEDTPETDEYGRTIVHKKGEVKLDKKGLPYYETLGNRDSSGKDFLLHEDIISVDGSKWNKFDFFDADGKRTEPWKVAAHTIARVVPYLLPFGIGKIYAGVKAAQGLTEFMPQFLKSVDAVFTNDVMGNEFGRTMNDISGFMARLDHGVSDHSREHLVTWENAAKMFADVSGQLFEQKAVQGVASLFKNPAIRNNANLAKGLSYFYMAATSSEEAYDIFKSAGANDRTAGIALWALMGIYYKLMSADYYKHALFRNSWIDENNIKEPTKKLVELYQKEIALNPEVIKTATQEEAVKTLNWFQKNWEKLLGISSKLENSGVLGGKTWLSSALSEGVEEVTEELGIDTLKGLAKGLEALGFDVTEANKKLDFGFSAQDVLQRYGMSFAGGAFGGAVFHGYNLLDPNYRESLKAEKLPENVVGDIVSLVIQGRQNEIYKELARGFNNQEYGSNDLSATKFNVVRDVDGEVVAFQGANGEMSQNEMVYNEVYKTIKFIENILKENGFNKALNNVKEVLKINDEQAGKLLFTGQSFINYNAQNLILDDLRKIGTNIVRITTEMRKIEESNRPKDGSDEKLSDILANDANYQDLTTELQTWKDRRDQIYNKENISKYVLQSSIALDNDILDNFLGFHSADSYAQARYGKPLAEFTKKQQAEILSEFNDYFNGSNVNIFEIAYLYDALSKKLGTQLLEKDTELSKVSPDDTVRTETVGKQLINKLGTIARLKSSIQQLENKEEKTENDITKLEELKQEKERLTQEVNTTIQDPEKLISRVHVGDFDDIELSDFALALTEWYHSLEGKHKYDDADYNRFLNRIKNRYAIQLLRRGFEQKVADVRDDAGVGFEEGAEELIGFDPNNPDEFFWSGEYSQIQSDFVDLLKDFYSLLNVDNTQAIEKYNQIRTLLKDRAKLDDATIDSLLSDPLTEVVQNEDGSITRNDFGVSLIPFINGKFLPDIIQEIEDSRKKITYSNATSLIRDFLTAVNDDSLFPLVDLLEREESRLNNVGEYTIGNSFYREQLKTLRSIVNAVSGIINGSYDGLNEFLNPYLQQEKLDLFPVISKNTATILHNDLETLKDRINFILLLDEKNSNLKLREQKDVGANMRSKFLSKLTNHVYIKDFEDAFGFNLEDVIRENSSADFDINSITAENYSKFEKEIIAIETAIYNKIKESGLSDEEIIDNLILIYGSKDLYKLQTTKLTKEKDEIVTDYDLILYAASLMKLNSNDFYVLYRDSINHAREVDPEFKIVPVFGQEFALKLAYSLTKNPKFFNSLLSKIATTYTGTEPYQLHKRILFNMLNVFGGAGSGKSRGVGAMLQYIFPNAEFRFLGPTDSQVNSLLSIFGKTTNSDEGLTISEFKEKVVPGIDNSENLEWSKETEQVETKETNVKDFAWFSTDGGLRIIVADEIAMNNSIMLKALSDYAVKYNAIVIGLGDPKQNTNRLTFNKEGNVVTQYDGFEECVSLNTPYLVANFRAAYRAKVDNYIELLSTISNVDDEVQKANTGLTKTQVDDILTEQNKGRVTQLKSFNRNDSIVGDSIISNENDFKRLVDTVISKKDATVLIVTDASTDSKYVDEKFNASNITKQHADKAQGGEYDYVIVDKAIDIDRTGRYGAIKDLYTISQRSTLGSVIFDPNSAYEKQLNIISANDPSSVVPWEMSESQKAEYGNWWMEAHKDLIPSEQFEENTAIYGAASEIKTEEKPKQVVVEEVVKEEKVEEKEENPAVEPSVPEENPENNEEPESEEPVKVEEESTPAENPAITKVKIPTATVKDAESEEAIVLNPWIEEVASSFEDQFEETKAEEKRYGGGYFRVDDFFNDIFSNNFFVTQKSVENSAYNFFRKNNIDLNEKEYQEFVLWAARKILQNDFDFNSVKDLNIGVSKIQNLKRVLSKLSLKTARIITTGDKSELRGVFSDALGNALFEVPFAKSPILKEGVISLDGVRPFSVIGNVDYNHSNTTPITIGELKKKYPWLRFSLTAGTVIDTKDFSGSTDSKYENARDFILRNLGKTIVIAYGLKNQNPGTLFQTSVHPIFGNVYLGQDPLNTRKFAIQKIVDNYDDVILYATALTYLSTWDSDALDFLKKNGWVTDEYNSQSNVLDKLYDLTGNIAWKTPILRTKINQESKDPLVRKELWAQYFSVLNSADQSSTLINWAQNERILADLFGNLLRSDGNKSTWFKLHTTFHNINDRSFGLVIKLDEDNQFILYTDSKTNIPGKIYVAEYNKTTYRPGNIIYTLETQGNPDTFAAEFKNAIQLLLQLPKTQLSLDDFNSNRIRITAAQISYKNGKIDQLYVSDSLRNWFSIFNPASIIPLREVLNSEQYKHKLYGNIPVNGRLENSQFGESSIDDNYVTMASEWVGETVYFDPSKIISSKSNNVNQTVAIQSEGTHSINRISDLARTIIPSEVINELYEKYTNLLASIDNIQDTDLYTLLDNMISEINAYALNSTLSRRTSQIKVSDNGVDFVLYTIDSSNMAYVNLIRSLGDVVPDNMQITRFKFQNVDIVEGVNTNIPTHYIFYEEEGKLKIKKTVTYNDWNELKEQFNVLADTIDNEKNSRALRDIGSYINHLLLDNVTDTDAVTYWKRISEYHNSNIQEEFDFAENIQSNIEKYLISRITNNEC